MDKRINASIHQAEALMRKVPDAFHGGLEHAKKVVEIAEEIAKTNPDSDKDIVLLAGWWHDTGRIYGNDGHEKRSALMAQNDLQRRGFENDFCRKVYLAIAPHRFDMKPVSLEGNIIRDADKLALLDTRRWEIAIKDKKYHKFEHTIHVLPKVRDEILELEISKHIYDKMIISFLEYVTAENDSGFQRQREEILSLQLNKIKSVV